MPALATAVLPDAQISPDEDFDYLTEDEALGLARDEILGDALHFSAWLAAECEGAKPVDWLTVLALDIDQSRDVPSLWAICIGSYDDHSNRARRRLTELAASTLASEIAERAAELLREHA